MLHKVVRLGTNRFSCPQENGLLTRLGYQLAALFILRMEILASGNSTQQTVIKMFALGGWQLKMQRDESL